MADQSVFAVLNRAVSRLNDMLESTSVAHNGVSLADIEETKNDLQDVLTVLHRMKGVLCNED